MKRYSAVLSLILLLGGHVGLFSQTKAEIARQAEAQLRQMTPAEIEVKIREFGMTRQQAEAKAQEIGVDLNTYLQKHAAVAPASAPLPSTVQPAASLSVADTSLARVRQELKQEVGEQIKEGVQQRRPAAQMQAEARTDMPNDLGVRELPLFGLSIFQTRAESFQPTPSISDKEYVIGSGDVLKFSLWGTVEMMNEFYSGH